jgi:hypothetical protein
MVERAAWFTRKFSFDLLPVWMYPNVLERLRGTPARLEDLLRAQPSETLIRRDNDKWSMQEHAGHLLDLEPLGMNRLDDYEAGRRMLHAADLENRKTHEANHNAHSIIDILADFRAERMEFVRRLDEYDEAFVQKTALHPRLQMEVRLLDLAFFIAEHDDHHLARISELIRLFARIEYQD